MLKYSLRGCADWRNNGLTIRSTTSDEATKLYDSALNQFCGLYDDKNYGGIPQTLADMTRADPNFVLGQCLELSLTLSPTLVDISHELESKVKHFLDLVDKNKNSYEEREVKHVEAVRCLAKGDVKGATRVWEEILCEYPTDIHAIRMSNGLYFENGMQNQLRDSIARVLPHWTGSGLPLEGYVHGMYAFGLEENNLFTKAESEARIALDMNECDGWATHAIAHIDDTLGRTSTGLRFLTNTEGNWKKSDYIACHNYWHLALHHIQREEWESAVSIFDDQIIPRAETSGRLGNLVDATQLLFRLDLAQPDPESVYDQRWQRVYSVAKAHFPTKFRLGFIDAHLLLASLGSKQSDSVEEITEKIMTYEGSDQWLRTTRTIANALQEYHHQNYGKCVNLLFEIKDETQSMGGSNAQRQLFTDIMISAALKSPVGRHKKLAQNLMNESKSFTL